MSVLHLRLCAVQVQNVQRTGATSQESYRTFTVDFQGTTRSYITRDGTVHAYSCEELKSDIQIKKSEEGRPWTAWFCGITMQMKMADAFNYYLQ
jgi:hypothetical protein